MSLKVELSHGRIEERAVRVLPIEPTQVCFPCMRMAIEVRRVSKSKKTSEVTRGRRLFLTDQTEIDQKELAAEIRRRWNIENKNHHPRDGLAFLEDKCRCRTGNTAANLALLRGAVITLWKKNAPDLPATAFVTRCQRKLDKSICLITKLQRLTKN